MQFIWWSVGRLGAWTKVFASLIWNIRVWIVAGKRNTQKRELLRPDCRPRATRYMFKLKPINWQLNWFIHISFQFSNLTSFDRSSPLLRHYQRAFHFFFFSFIVCCLLAKISNISRPIDFTLSNAEHHSTVQFWSSVPLFCTRMPDAVHHRSIVFENHSWRPHNPIQAVAIGRQFCLRTFRFSFSLSLSQLKLVFSFSSYKYPIVMLHCSIEFRQ